MKKFESKNKPVAVNTQFAENDNEIKQTYISKNNSNRQNKIIFLLITDAEKFAVKDVSVITRDSIKA